MYDHTQTTTEVAGAIFYAMLSLYDDDAERESIQLLREAVSTGAVKDPIARSILTSIVGSSKVAAGAAVSCIAVKCV
jgi:hypothetical protein